MATSVVPKSELRKNDNISVGYGEVPAVEQPGGETCWGLPNGEIECDPDKAEAYARKLDETIRANMTDIGQLMHASK